jgi:two-component system OmpR family sensor kinase
MFKSIRWRLQVWHAAILLLAVAGFGAVLYAQVRRARFDEIDAELRTAASTLEGVLRGFPPPVLEGKDAPPPPPPPRGPRPGSPPSPPPPPRDGDDRRGPYPPGPPRPLREHLDEALRLPDHFRGRPGSPPPYFVVWRPDGSVLKAIPSAPVTPPALPPEPPSPRPAPGGFVIHQRGDFREVVLRGPHGTRVLVGRSIGPELADLTRLAWQLLSTGLGVLAVGLAGGWLLSRRAVRPIEAMSATAAAISADNLSRRIDLTGVDSELGRLGQILNAMFGRLEAAFERQVRFTADASHELRTPLAVIHSHAELALARPRSAEDYRAALEASLRAAKRMKGLVDGLLTLARADAGRLEMTRDQLDLGELVEESAALLAPLAAAAGVRVSLAAKPVAVTGDAGRLAQVVTNLLTNAIHYNRAGGSVMVKVDGTAREAVLTVGDTGCGIPQGDRQHIFERFYRVDKARSRELGGSGLGLAICKSIVEAHGGAITFTSEVDRGTTFEVRLPLRAATAE